MAEETSVPSKSAKANDGFNGPIPDPGDSPVPDHIHPETLMAKGVDPDTRETVAASLAVLVHQHGAEKGRKIYNKVAKAGGFFNPDQQAYDFTPDLQLEGLADDTRKALEAILKG